MGYESIHNAIHNALSQVSKPMGASGARVPTQLRTVLSDRKRADVAERLRVLPYRDLPRFLFQSMAGLLMCVLVGAMLSRVMFPPKPKVLQPVIMYPRSNARPNGYLDYQYQDDSVYFRRGSGL